jgi:hypothetical protein
MTGSQHTKQFHVSVPSHRKVDGHVRYRLEVRAARIVTNILLNSECETRLSEIRHFKNQVKQIMGTRAYRTVIKAAFPGGFAGTSARLELWFNEVVSQCGKPQFPELTSLVLDFLRIRDSPNEGSSTSTPTLEPTDPRASNSVLRPFSPFKLFHRLTAKSSGFTRPSLRTTNEAWRHRKKRNALWNVGCLLAARVFQAFGEDAFKFLKKKSKIKFA